MIDGLGTHQQRVEIRQVTDGLGTVQQRWAVQVQKYRSIFLVSVPVARVSFQK